MESYSIYSIYPNPPCRLTRVISKSLFFLWYFRQFRDRTHLKLYSMDSVRVKTFQSKMINHWSQRIRSYCFETVTAMHLFGVEMGQIELVNSWGMCGHIRWVSVTCITYMRSGIHSTCYFSVYILIRLIFYHHWNVTYFGLREPEFVQILSVPGKLSTKRRHGVLVTSPANVYRTS